MPQRVIKDAQAVLDYKFDWANTTNGGDVADWLDTAGDEVISTYTVTANDAGITIDSDELSDDDTSVTVWLSGGTVGETYRITNHIVTSLGREDDRTLTVKVESR